MSVTISTVANTQSFGAVTEKLNQLTQIISSNVLTTDLTAVGATTTGNASISGTFGANNLSALFITGGLPGNSTFTAPITVLSNVNVSNSTLTVGNSTTSVLLSTTSNTVISARGVANGYVEALIYNTSSGLSASGDLTIGNDLVTNTSNYIDVGINSSLYADPTWTVNGPGDGYLFTSNGNLAIGTMAAKPLIFFANGTLANNEIGRIAPNGNFGINTKTPNAKFHVSGNANLDNNVVVGGTLTVGNTTVNNSINSTSYSGISNNTLYLGGMLANSYAPLLNPVFPVNVNVTNSLTVGSTISANVAIIAYSNSAQCIILSTNTGYAIQTFASSGRGAVFNSISGFGMSSVSNSSYAAYFESYYGSSLISTSNTGSAVFGQSYTSYGGYFTSTSGIGLYATSILTPGNISTNTLTSNTTIIVGNTTVNNTINSTSYSGVSNSALYLGTQPAANFVNTSQLSANIANFVNTSQLSANLTNYVNTSQLSANIVNFVNTSQLSANLTNYVNTSQFTSNLSNYALLSGATFTGNVVLNANATFVLSPTAPTVANGDNSTKVSTTAFVNNSITVFSSSNPNFTNGFTTSNVVTINGFTTINASANVVGDLRVTGNLTATSLIYSGTSTGDIIPNNNTYNLGNTTNRWTVWSLTSSVLTSVNIGNSTVNNSINSTSYSGTANNALYLGGVAVSNYVNTSQLTSNLSNYALLSGATFTGNVSSNNTLSNNVYANTITIANLSLDTITTFNGTIIGDQIVDNMSASTYRSAEYLIQASANTNYQITKILVIHDGATPYTTEFGSIYNNAVLSTFRADINSGNVRLFANATSNNVVFKISRKAITI